MVGNIVAVFLALIGVAMVAVIVSKGADTANVISATAGGFAKSVAAVVSPVTGGTNRYAAGIGNEH